MKSNKNFIILQPTLTSANEASGVSCLLRKVPAAISLFAYRKIKREIFCERKTFSPAPGGRPLKKEKNTIKIYTIFDKKNKQSLFAGGERRAVKH